MRTLDLLARHEPEYRAARAPRVVSAGPGRYLCLTGRGEREGESFRLRSAALLAVARGLRAATRGRGKDFRICPLEALWWTGSPADAGDGGAAAWSWKLLVRVPNFVRSRDLTAVAERLLSRGAGAEVREVQLEALREGRCIQALHLGPRGDALETLDRMRRAAARLGLAFHGRRHEIYLCDPWRTRADRLRTLLRQPVRAAR